GRSALIRPPINDHRFERFQTDNNIAKGCKELLSRGADFGIAGYETNTASPRPGEGTAVAFRRTKRALAAVPP
ncbi:MAG: hypothetical protein ACLFTV_18825, partial [Desulfococcaceae bacterium]